VWSRKTGKPLSRAIVWDDSRTRGVVAHYEHLLKTQGIEVNGQLRSGTDGAEGLKEL
jgi:glycerol kinase